MKITIAHTIEEREEADAVLSALRPLLAWEQLYRCLMPFSVPSGAGFYAGLFILPRLLPPPPWGTYSAELYGVKRRHFMETINTNQDIQQRPTTPTPEASGDQGGERMFTQDDVNRIVSERLARERQKTEPSAIDEREAQLKARESRLNCRDYLEALAKDGKVGPSVTGLIDVLDTSDKEKFRKTVTALLEIGAFNPQLEPLKLPGVDKHGFGSMNIDHLISTAFKPKT